MSQPKQERERVSSVVEIKHALGQLEDVLRPKQRLELDGGVVMVVCDLDASKAEYIVKSMHGKQRHMRPQHLRRITRNLESHKFLMTGDPLHFDKHANCINGQHRVNAVLQSGVTIHNAVCMLGMETDILMVLDTNIARRSGRDALKMATGKTCPTAVFSAIVIEFCDFEAKQRKELTRAEQAEVVRDCPYLTELASLRAAGVVSGAGTPGGVLGAALRCMRVERELGYEFFALALKNEHEINGERSEALKLLSTAIFNARGSAGNHGYEQVKEMAGRCIKAWNAYRTGAAVRALRYSGSVPPAV